jgi:hypothetical protein
MPASPPLAIRLVPWDIASSDIFQASLFSTHETTESAAQADWHARGHEATVTVVAGMYQLESCLARFSLVQLNVKITLRSKVFILAGLQRHPRSVPDKFLLAS